MLIHGNRFDYVNHKETMFFFQILEKQRLLSRFYLFFTAVTRETKYEAYNPVHK